MQDEEDASYKRKSTRRDEIAVESGQGMVEHKAGNRIKEGQRQKVQQKVQQKVIKSKKNKKPR